MELIVVFLPHHESYQESPDDSTQEELSCLFRLGCHGLVLVCEVWLTECLVEGMFG